MACTSIRSGVGEVHSAYWDFDALGLSSDGHQGHEVRVKLFCAVAHLLILVLHQPLSKHSSLFSAYTDPHNARVWPQLGVLQ